MLAQPSDNRRSEMLSHGNIARELLLLLLVAYLFVSMKAFRTALNPLGVAIAPWLAIIAAQEFLAPSMYLSWLAAAIIGGSLLCVGLGAFIVTLYSPRERFVPESPKLEPTTRHSWLRRCVFGAIISAVAVHLGITFYFGILQGFGLSSNGTFLSYTLFDQIFSSALAWPYRIATTLLQIGAVVCSLELQTKRPVYGVVILYLAMVTLESVFIASRFGLYLVLSEMILGWVVFGAQRFRGVSLRLVLSFTLGLSIAAALYGFTTGRRTGHENRDTGQMMAAGLISSPSVLTGILADRGEWIHGTLKGETFLSPLMLMTGQGPETWNFNAYPIAPDMSETSNIVSGLYLLLLDFGIGGCAIVLTLMGAISTWLFLKFNAEPTVRRAGILLLIYLLLFWLVTVVLTFYTFFWCFIPVLLNAGLLYRVVPDSSSVAPSRGRKIGLFGRVALPRLAQSE